MRLHPAILFFLPLALAASCGKPDPERIKAEIISEVNRTPVLHTVKASAQVIVTEQDSPDSYKRYFGSRVVLVPVKATIKAGVDLSRIQRVSWNEEDKSIHILLPPPLIEIESTTIDNERVITDVGPLRFDFSADEIARIALRGRKEIERLIPQMDLDRQSSERAAQILAGICDKLGYTNIKIDYPTTPPVPF